MRWESSISCNQWFVTIHLASPCGHLRLLSTNCGASGAGMLDGPLHSSNSPLADHQMVSSGWRNRKFHHLLWFSAALRSRALDRDVVISIRHCRYHI
ncbi:hypothetical protein K491DRAFT_452947 [Lophiostoma macrostomum CBS 122681]|uniref:Uncharacterized protein n=1 Tax=Lophiostoma macrostomum CBS 122681 TaxID=1314788 RepID=A0A6A6TNR6_9PLEO|nr:hypothetical protein K491DRAFT_452947 [Lophiostoma macrostomum CBS 122681]